jgi:hypothetical protein
MPARMSLMLVQMILPVRHEPNSLELCGVWAASPSECLWASWPRVYGTPKAGQQGCSDATGGSEQHDQQLLAGAAPWGGSCA